MNELQIFNNPDFGEVRSMEIDGKVYFVGKDIAVALGYSNVRDALSRHCKGVVKRDVGVQTGFKRDGNPAMQNIQMNIIPEGDLYRLIANSKLPAAERFELWIFDEVLPTVRQTGAYMTPQKIEEILINPDTVIELATQIKALQLTNTKQTQIIGELKPKADYLDRILQSKALQPITSIAKDYGMSGQAFNKLLHKLGVQYKQSGQWLLYAKYHARGYTHSETVGIVHSNGMPDIKISTKWTQKGRLFLYDLLKERGVYPSIENKLSA